MSGWKQPSLLTRNKNEISACILILETNKSENEEYLFFSYKTNDFASTFINLKGIILASVSLSNTMWGDDYKVLLCTDIKGNIYKIFSVSYLKSFIISVIFPAIIPDNVLFYVGNEFLEFVKIFFENFKESKNLSEILNKISETLIYNTLNFSIGKENEDFLGSPLSNLPIINLTFSYNESVPNFISKIPIKDSLKMEITEILYTLNSDRSLIQETLTFMEQPFYVKGFTLFFKWYTIFTTLSNNELSNLSRLAMIHELHVRTQSSSEVLVCEFIYDNDKFSINGYNGGQQSVNLNTNLKEEKKKCITTILAQREFVLIILLDILGKNNSSFDPFYHKRAEDLMIGILKKGYSLTLDNEIKKNSVKLIETENNEKEEKKKENEKEKENNKSPAKRQSTSKINTSMLNSRIEGFIDTESKVNIIHFSCFDDSECVINTTDVFVGSDIYKEIYKEIFHKYAKIQTNINKIKSRNKINKLRNVNCYQNLVENYGFFPKNDGNIKNKLLKEKYFSKFLKLNEFAMKLNVENYIPIWVCCKMYEHISILNDEANLEEFSNYKIIFLAYESHIAVDVNNFCQDLLINDTFI